MPIKSRLKKFMSIALITSVLLIIALLGWFFILGKMSQSGHSPGLVDGKLAPCPDKRNCVCSEFANDSLHYIEPVLIEGRSIESVMATAATMLQDMGGDIQQQTDSYLAATFSSDLFGFVDDLELRFVSDENLVHIRSGSRVGDSDLGVNRKRVEQFKNRLLNANAN